tara:strand:- start:1233 stop:2147 length:915 start_codon:yes stop_codon:yes gene_type:complete
MSEQQVKKIFGKEASMMFNGGQFAIKAFSSRDFAFMPQTQHGMLAKDDPKLALDTAYRELLFRCYIAATTSIMRSDSWLKNLLRAKTLDEALLFCASLRGLLEATGDALDITGYLLQTLAEDHEVLCSYLEHEPTKIHVHRELEDRLIHFTHARKLSKEEKETFPESHSAQQIFQYIDNLETAGVIGAKDCYAEMCDFTHPGLSSLQPWMTEEADSLKTHPRKDRILIADILKRYKHLFIPLLRTIYNPGLMTLNLLNHFPVKSIHTPALLKLTWHSAPGWEKAERKLKISRFYRPNSYAITRN